jgi:light-regulated signal transduction histidine kinase (bacteriophytochrome)
VVKWFGTCTDVDDHKRLEESLRRRSEELARSNEELQRFAYIVSHDLQEPLRTIGAMSQLLRRHCSESIDEKGETLFQHIQTGVKRMGDLIRDLLEYSRVSSESDVQLKPVDCESLVSFALMNVQAQITETGATVTREPLPLVTGDEQLVRVFQNLIGNALKYRADRIPQIHISALKNNDEWIVSIRDNGIGIDMKYAERIFGVFQRLHSRTAYEGTGIGLAICRKIVERCGGRIWVESVPDEGATFHFSLRAAKGGASSAA